MAPLGSFIPLTPPWSVVALSAPQTSGSLTALCPSTLLVLSDSTFPLTLPWSSVMAAKPLSFLYLIAAAPPWPPDLSPGLISSSASPGSSPPSAPSQSVTWVHLPSLHNRLYSEQCNDRYESEAVKDRLGVFSMASTVIKLYKVKITFNFPQFMLCGVLCLLNFLRKMVLQCFLNRTIKKQTLNNSIIH